MYLGVDIGATKTIVAAFSESGEIKKSKKFPTNKDYKNFLLELAHHVDAINGAQARTCCVAVPGLLDSSRETAISLGNLPWRDIPIKKDLSGTLNGVPVVIEHDTALGALSEAQFVTGYRDVLYLTISTGIGGGLVSEGRIVKSMADSEPGKIPLQFEGKLMHWEDFASGRAIVERFGQKASDIKDDETWQVISGDIAYGVSIVSSVVNPEAIIFGGGVGQFFNKFADNVASYMDQHLHTNTKRPKLLQAKRPNEAVVYGCYLLAKEVAK